MFIENRMNLIKLAVRSLLQVLQDCMRHHGSLVEIGKIWVSDTCSKTNKIIIIMYLLIESV